MPARSFESFEQTSSNVARSPCQQEKRTITHVHSNPSIQPQNYKLHNSTICLMSRNSSTKTNPFIGLSLFGKSVSGFVMGSSLKGRSTANY